MKLSIITYVCCKNQHFLKYIESYLNNITSIKNFENYELVIVNVKSSNTSHENIIMGPYIERFSNIKRIMVDTVSCQYDAWNIAIKNSTGEYLTNSNLDDRRSFKGTSQLIDCVDDQADVHYGYVMFEEDVNKIISNKLNSTLKYPAFNVNTIDDLFLYNSPHCFPVWSRSLHDRAGYFNTSYPNVGDYEFWLRCKKIHDTQFKYHDVCVGTYYYSPEGLSTNSKTRGQVAHENRRMRMLYGLDISCDYLSLAVKPYGIQTRIKSLKRYTKF